MPYEINDSQKKVRSLCMFLNFDTVLFAIKIVAKTTTVAI